MWDLIVSVPAHCLSFTLNLNPSFDVAVCMTTNNLCFFYIKSLLCT